MLVDHADPLVDRPSRRGDPDLVTLDDDRPSSGGVQPVQHPHQRRLPRTVLTDQGVDLARLQLQGDASLATTPGNRFVMCSMTTKAGRSRAPPLVVAQSVIGSTGCLNHGISGFVRTRDLPSMICCLYSSIAAYDVLGQQVGIALRVIDPVLRDPEYLEPRLRRSRRSQP